MSNALQDRVASLESRINRFETLISTITLLYNKVVEENKQMKQTITDIIDKQMADALKIMHDSIKAEILAVAQQ